MLPNLPRGMAFHIYQAWLQGPDALFRLLTDLSDAPRMGSIPAYDRQKVTLVPNRVTLANSGDGVLLIDDSGTLRYRVSYTEAQAVSGRVIALPQDGPDTSQFAVRR